MKKSIFIIVTVLFLCSSYFLVKRFSVDSKIFTDENAVNYNILAAGLKGARDFTSKDKDIYIAYKNKIQVIEKNGKSYTLLEDRSADIRSIEYYDNKLYIVNGASFLAYDINSKKSVEIIKDIPNFGDYGQCKLMLKDKKIYLAIGAATNSGVVGEDNMWRGNFPFNHDIATKNITIGNQVSGKTGGFVPYNTKNIPGQKISGHFPGNASVIVYSTEKSESSLYCWGIRNIKAMDYDSYGRIFAAVGGMEYRGERSVKGDVDYIYELKYDIWYGWPDFSGGDPINSPRFKGSNGGKISFLLQSHPTSNPPAPFYQHKNLSTLSALAIDRGGALGKKDCIYFYDNSDNMIYNINNKGILEKSFKFDKDAKINIMKIINSKLLILEENEGLLIQMGDRDNSIDKDGRVILVYVISLITIISGLIIWKLKNQ